MPSFPVSFPASELDVQMVQKIIGGNLGVFGMDYDIQSSPLFKHVEVKSDHVACTSRRLAVEYKGNGGYDSGIITTKSDHYFFIVFSNSTPTGIPTQIRIYETPALKHAVFHDWRLNSVSHLKSDEGAVNTFLPIGTEPEQEILKEIIYL